MKGIICILAAGVLFAGCATTSNNPQHAQARSKAAQLHQGMTPKQVERVLGHPDKVHQDDGWDHGHAYIPYYGWHHHGSHGDEMKWEYKDLKIEVIFRRTGDGWVVKEWDRD